MVRRRGIYEINIRDKELICPFCQNSRFTHREVYMDLLSKEVKEQLAMQSFTCTSCGNIRMFQEKNQFDHTLEKHVCIIGYTEVIEE